MERVMAKDFDEDSWAEVINEAAEYVHDKGYCLEDCPFCETEEEDDEG